jgi:hypothetical protein
MAWDYTEVAVVAEIDADNATIKVRVLENGKSARYIDARTFIESRKYQGPTKQGLFLEIDEAKQLRDALTEAINVAEQ